jgi:hypothetical protein
MPFGLKLPPFDQFSSHFNNAILPEYGSGSTQSSGTSQGSSGKQPPKSSSTTNNSTASNKSNNFRGLASFSNAVFGGTVGKLSRPRMRLHNWRPLEGEKPREPQSRP